jgi:Cu-Zn family superoxide dismutase
MTKHIPIIGLLTLLAACNRDAGGSRTADDDASRKADVELKAAEGSVIEGSGTLQEDVGGVRLTLHVEDAPVGEKGIHIHEKGDCSDIAGKSMGGHFSPDQHEHALPNERTNTERHLGDIGNIRVDADGNGKLEFLIRDASLRRGEVNSLIGRAVVVHEDRDKGAVTQPSGGSGKPIACGVIEAD